MRIITTVAEARAARAQLNGRVGFVPTMGALHDGHIHLVRTAAQTCAAVIVSIFVNPTQFAPHDDLSKYPRQMEQDCQLLEKEGCVPFVFAPTPEIMYGTCTNHHNVSLPLIYVDAERLVAGRVEAKCRPGHFSGVATVCTKLFSIVQPDACYFGLKDRLQCWMIQQMAAVLNLPYEIVPVPTQRESHGLARSSRNMYLTSEEFQKAGVIYAAMQRARDLFGSETRSVGVLRKAVEEHITTVEGMQIQYVVISDPRTLEDLNDAEMLVDNGVVQVAVKYGAARLIDNLDLAQE
eukprot:TRINITY_DN19826_c0_g1_i1.p1 TRINITY_DN19826_c0_g1~~TRINITY_DN19826_c0_g1_i1.p1  ORF type:complete len:304 (-),score=47.46 TRINITY_DN19826_c0_g1_i1:3-881(-)